MSRNSVNHITSSLTDHHCDILFSFTPLVGYMNGSFISHIFINKHAYDDINIVMIRSITTDQDDPLTIQYGSTV